MVTRYFCSEKCMYTVVTRMVPRLVTRGDDLPGGPNKRCLKFIHFRITKVKIKLTKNFLHILIKPITLP